MTLDTTKADDIALVIEEAIVSGELAPGTVLRQEQLSEQFNVSRTPVREALRRLAALGLVSFVPNRGVRVRTISREELHEAFMVRAELESLATEVAATAFGDFLQAAGTVLRTPTLIWIFVGGALVTFAVNGLIAWAPSFLERTHGLPVAAVGRQFGVWGLAGGALGALFGGRTGDWLLARWSAGRVL